MTIHRQHLADARAPRATVHYAYTHPVYTRAKAEREREREGERETDRERERESMHRVAGSMRLITQLDSLVDTGQTER